MIFGHCWTSRRRKFASRTSAPGDWAVAEPVVFFQDASVLERGDGLGLSARDPRAAEDPFPVPDELARHSLRADRAVRTRDGTSGFFDGVYAFGLWHDQ